MYISIFGYMYDAVSVYFTDLFYYEYRRFATFHVKSLLILVNNIKVRMKFIIYYT